MNPPQRRGVDRRGVITRRSGRYPSDQAARLLRSYEGLAKERAEIEALLVKLAPAWAELRKVLKELNRVLEA